MCEYLYSDASRLSSKLSSRKKISIAQTILLIVSFTQSIYVQYLNIEKIVIDQ